MEGHVGADDGEKTEPRLRALIAQVIGVPEEEVDGLEAESCPTWTSLNHLMLVSQLESTFDISLSNAEIAAATDYATLRDTVQRHLRTD